MSQIIYHFDGHTVALGQTHPEVDYKLQGNPKNRWVILTAENPRGELFPVFVNKQRTITFQYDLEDSFYQFSKGKGVAEGYPEEVSFLILGVDLKEAFALAQKYKQQAIITGVVGGFAELIRLEA